MRHLFLNDFFLSFFQAFQDSKKYEKCKMYKSENYGEVSLKFEIFKNLRMEFVLFLRFLISLASFDVRLVHAGTSVIFSDLIFSNFKFCLRKFKDLITLKNAVVLKNFAPFLHAKFIYFSINPTKIT